MRLLLILPPSVGDGPRDGPSVWFERIDYPDQPYRFAYLDNGLMVLASNQLGAVAMTYDGANRLASVSGLVSRIAYSYYPAGQVFNSVSLSGRTGTCWTRLTGWPLFRPTGFGGLQLQHQ